MIRNYKQQIKDIMLKDALPKDPYYEVIKIKNDFDIYLQTAKNNLENMSYQTAIKNLDNAKELVKELKKKVNKYTKK